MTLLHLSRLRLFATIALAVPTLAWAAPMPVTPEVAEPLRLGSFSVYTENDKYFAGTDQAYTNGLKLSYLSANLASFTDPSVPAPIRGISRALGHLVPEKHPYKLGFSFGQNIYTPVDTTTTAYQPADRPYAGWLYGSVAFHVLYPERLTGRTPRLDVFELQGGVVGPSALGEDFQNGFHDLIKVAHAEGWAHQIHDEPGANLIYERRYRYSTHPVENRLGLGIDLIPHLGLSLGNIFTYTNAGAELRAGWNLPADFGSNLIRPSGDSNSPTRPRFHVFLFSAFDARAVARDITLDGNTFEASPSIDKKPFVADLYAGLGIGGSAWQIRYAQAYRTKEFEGQAERQVFGSISVSFFR